MPCRYNVTTALLTEPSRDSMPLSEIETKLKKLEKQLMARAAKSSSSSTTAVQQQRRPSPPLPLHQELQRQQQQQQQQSTTTTTKSKPRFSLEPTGLCIETGVTEVHHFIKLLFSTINIEKIRNRARNVFAAHSRSSMGAAAGVVADDIYNKPPDVLLNELLARNDAVEQKWLEMIINSWHHRCTIVYQMVGTRYSPGTNYLQQFSGAERTRELLLAMSVRAYIYHHEDELHQDTEYHLQTAMGPVYLQCALALLEDCHTISHRTTIRALLHLFLYHFHDKAEEAFPYCDLALRMAQDLDLHKRRSQREHHYQQQHQQNHLNDVMRAEDDRRLWWATYWCQLYTIVEYNRPTVLQDDEIEVAMPQKLPSENADVGYCIDYCIMSIKLLRLRRSIAAALKKSDTTNALLYQVRDLENGLEEWYRSLPKHAQLTPRSNATTTCDDDPLRRELSLLLHAQYYSIKIQMYQCFLENSTALSLMAVRNSEQAAASVTNMLVQYGSAMRMCSCVRMVPTLHRCVAILASNAEFKESSAIALDAVERLRMLGSVLKSYSFRYVEEIAAVIRLIDSTLQLYPPNPTTKPPKTIAPAAISTPQRPANVIPTEPHYNTPTSSSAYSHAAATGNITTTATAAADVSQNCSSPPHQEFSSPLVVKQKPLDDSTPSLSVATFVRSQQYQPEHQPTMSTSALGIRQKHQYYQSTPNMTEFDGDNGDVLVSLSSSSDMVYQKQQMATPTGDGGSDKAGAEYEQMMNAYQQRIVPSTLSSGAVSFANNLGLTATNPVISNAPEQIYTSAPSLKPMLSDTQVSPPQSSRSHQQQSYQSPVRSMPQSQLQQQQQQHHSQSNRAWTSSVPINSETFALLDIADGGKLPLSLNNSIQPSIQQQSIPQQPTFASNNKNTELYIARSHLQTQTQPQPQQQQQQHQTSSSPRTDRTAPFSKGSIFHRAPAPPRTPKNDSMSVQQHLHQQQSSISTISSPSQTAPFIQGSIFHRVPSLPGPSKNNVNIPQQQEQPRSSISSTSYRIEPFSQGSIFRRAPPPTRPSNNILDDSHLAKFPIAAPPTFHQPSLRLAQEQQYVTISELPNLSTDDSSSSSNHSNMNIDSSSSTSYNGSTSSNNNSRRATHSPQTDTSSNFDAMTSSFPPPPPYFYHPWTSPSDADESSSSSQPDRSSPGIVVNNHQSNYHNPPSPAPPPPSSSFPSHPPSSYYSNR
ncbi:hypothetical protein BDB00DRAFT_871204 [Zychaea mexicana]|uniref:uncharacterized protein n=1 Tax=Zychaea mexicana TaxID=64656 RepID=UPI0022FF13B8|nr:uncharacterized protein BDB00DRAFT_871204 [Zychaea mexicana]KAI9494652.1 hypothetical protein BDB00DRAFT_871204 [Zychaea mexicana]